MMLLSLKIKKRIAKEIIEFNKKRRLVNNVSLKTSRLGESIYK